MSAIEQRRRNVRVLELLTESFMADSRGDVDHARACIDAALEHDAQTYMAIVGGILIGEIPRPGQDLQGWDDYVGANREGLAAAEAEAGG